MKFISIRSTSLIRSILWMIVYKKAYKEYLTRSKGRAITLIRIRSSKLGTQKILKTWNNMLVCAVLQSQIRILESCNFDIPSNWIGYKLFVCFRWFFFFLFGLKRWLGLTSTKNTTCRCITQHTLYIMQIKLWQLHYYLS